jgi:hypothetical protein
MISLGFIIPSTQICLKPLQKLVIKSLDVIELNSSPFYFPSLD